MRRTDYSLKAVSPAVQGFSIPWSGCLLVFFFIIFLLGGSYTGYLFYTTAKDVVAHIQSPSLPVLRVPYLQIPIVAPGQPPAVPRTDLPNWEKKDRVTVLLLGIDERKGEYGPWRTDTMMLASVDPVSKTASLLSIPRDLWVPIPGYGENRINTANYTGDLKKYPGGGPALAKKTVQYNFGVPVHYYVLVNFDGFEKIIDTIGGIDIVVEQPIHDDTYPDDSYGYITVDIPAGLQHMDGATALQYARSRHGIGDFGRARRQQQILFAIREQALRLNLLPKLPELLDTLGDTVQTDLQPGEIINLAMLASDISQENVKTAVIDEHMTVEYVTPTSAQVLLPIREKIRPLIDEFFAAPVQAAPTPLPVPTVATQDLQALNQLAQEKARIIVQNGTPQKGLDARVATYLKDHGYQVIGFGQADRLDYDRTVIIDYTGKLYTLSSLVQLFKVAPENSRHSPVLRSEVDIRVIVGADFKLPEGQ
jgi:LCP family protein required for cell wall assembly